MEGLALIDAPDFLLTSHFSLLTVKKKVDINGRKRDKAIMFMKLHPVAASGLEAPRASGNLRSRLLDVNVSLVLVLVLIISSTSGVSLIA